MLAEEVLADTQRWVPPLPRRSFVQDYDAQVAARSAGGGHGAREGGSEGAQGSDFGPDRQSAQHSRFVCGQYDCAEAGRILWLAGTM